MTATRALALALALAAPPQALADAADAPAALSAAEFRAFAEGWTLHFEQDGMPYGAETFLQGDRTLWRPEGGDCAPGRWTAEGDSICFRYDAATACWRLTRDAEGVLALSVPDGGAAVRVARRERRPLSCAEDLVGWLGS